MKYVALLRRSVHDADTVSYEMQLSKIKEHVGDKELIVFREEGVSRDASLDKRPVLLDAISALKKGDVLIFWRLDRLVAGPNEYVIYNMVTKKHATLHSVEEPHIFESGPQAELLRTIQNAVNKYELESIRARTKRAMGERKQQGRRTGHIPYGFTLDTSRPVPHPKFPEITRYVFLKLDDEEQRMIETMRNLYLEEGLTYRDLAIRLNEMGLRNRGGSLWTKSSVHRILKHIDHHEPYYQAITSPDLQLC